MRKLLISVGTLIFVGALTVGATGAFFSDTETSTGNTFTAGALDLKVDDSQHYAGLVCVPDVTGPGSHWIQDILIGPNPTTRPDLLGQPCDGTWNFTDLTPTFDLSHHFFDFADVKPGDQGENTISLHVDNSAWACLDIGTNADNENTRLQPEITAGDTTDDPNGGELSANMSVFAWIDNGTDPNHNIKPGDNVFEPNLNEQPIFGLTGVTLRSLTSTTTIPLADEFNGSPLVASTTNYIGLAWCVGSTTVDGSTGVITCDGSVVGNNIQTDSSTSTVQFRVQQSRNNPKFVCDPKELIKL